jgi:Flp pilus assembly protein TadD
MLLTISHFFEGVCLCYSPVVDNLKALFRLYVQPGAAMSAILDQGSLLFASLAVLAVSLVAPGRGGLSVSFFSPLLVLAVVYVPGVMLLTVLFGGVGGGFGNIFQRDYSPLLTCTAMAFTAASLPAVVAAFLTPAVAYIIAGLTLLFFMFLMFFAVRTVFGTENWIAAAVAGLSWVPLIAAAFLWGPLHAVMGWVASPFFLFYAWYYLGGEVRNLGNGLRRSQNFRRMLDAAAINPHDADAQLQLGLIYLERRQTTEATARFKNAIAIDPKEADGHFQLGKIAREQGRLKEALGYFQTVMSLDERHSQHEILRELGAVYLAAGQYLDARTFLAEYVEKRPYDPEGLYYLGQAMERLGKTVEARNYYGLATDVARTAPRYRRRLTAKWSRLAQKQIRKLPK